MTAAAGGVYRDAPMSPTLKRYYEHVFLERRFKERPGRQRMRSLRHHLEHYVLPSLGDRPLEEIAARDLMRLRVELLERVSVSSAKRIFADLRAVLREARYPDELITSNPAHGLPTWPRHDPPPPDPFTEEERDAIVHTAAAVMPAAWPFVLWLLWTGTRPGEATALRWRRVDLDRGAALIDRSRVAGDEHAPKTRGSRRTLALLPIVRAMLGGLAPTSPHVFIRDDGAPIDQERFAKEEWRELLGAAGVRHRKLYATRQTFISAALSRGCKLQWVAEYTGTSPAMIQRSYARFIGGDELELSRLGGGWLDGRGADASQGNLFGASSRGGGRSRPPVVDLDVDAPGRGRPNHRRPGGAESPGPAPPRRLDS